MPKVMLEGFECSRCGHRWFPRENTEEPCTCPKCKSPYWNRPRKGEIPIGERIKTKWTANQLKDKTVEFELTRENQKIAGGGEFRVAEGADGFMKISIWMPISASESVELKLSQAEADRIESYMSSRKYRFRCVH